MYHVINRLILHLSLIFCNLKCIISSSGGSDGKESVWNVRDPWVGKIPLQREMATHSSILA